MKKEYFSNDNRINPQPTLEATYWLMEQFGNPQNDMKFIHVAGTNGKGSVCEMLTNILIKGGYNVGKFISPHLIKYNERISVNNLMITDNEMCKIMEDLQKKIDEYNLTHAVGVTEFEVSTALALLYFSQKKCDIIVLETGLGGRLDCTNIVNPLISIITSVGYDHMHVLGNTIADITKEKAGIIKENSIAIVKYQENNNEIISDICKKNNTTLISVKEEDFKNIKVTQSFQQFDYNNYKDIKVNLFGNAQLGNAALCIECMENLQKCGFEIEKNAIYEGLNSVIHHARFEKICEKPKIIFDGAHNEDAIINLRATINQHYSAVKKVYIISLLKTKDYKVFIKNLMDGQEGTFIFTSGNSKDRFWNSEILYVEALKYKKDSIYQSKLDCAIIDNTNRKNDEVIFVIGSFYVYDDVIKVINERR